MNHRAHLVEEQLFECYLAERSGDIVDPPSAEHLADCEACAARYSDLTAFMDGLREEAVTEADAVFTPERLRAQQQQIARRLERLRQPARILSFPSQLVRRTMTGSHWHATPRWIAGAAAAGLFVGVAVGASYQHGARTRVEETLARQVSTTRLTPAAARAGNSTQLASDDAFLSDLEVALERPHTRELVAFDALTPHVRDVRAR